MKKIIQNIFFLMLFSSALNSQYYSKHHCDNYNEFTTLTNSNVLSDNTLIKGTSGYISLQPISLQDLGGTDSLYSYLNADSDSEFELIRVTSNYLDNDKSTFNFQQYKDDIKVVGGGFSLFINPDPEYSDGQGPGGGPGLDPCGLIYAMSPQILNEVDVSTTPTYSSGDLDSLLNVSSSDIQFSAATAAFTHDHNTHAHCTHDTTQPTTQSTAQPHR